MSNHGHMNEQEALRLVAEFAHNEAAIDYQFYVRHRDPTKLTLNNRKRLSEQIVRRLIGGKLSNDLKTQLAEQLNG